MEALMSTQILDLLLETLLVVGIAGVLTVVGYGALFIGLCMFIALVAPPQKEPPTPRRHCPRRRG
jgi:hypothetical protein